jgi:hypothetical protein
MVGLLRNATHAGFCADGRFVDQDFPFGDALPSGKYGYSFPVSYLL